MGASRMCLCMYEWWDHKGVHRNRSHDNILIHSRECNPLVFPPPRGTPRALRAAHPAPPHQSVIHKPPYNLYWHMFHMTNGRGHIKYKNDVLLIAVYETETNFYFEMYVRPGRAHS